MQQYTFPHSRRWKWFKLETRFICFPSDVGLTGHFCGYVYFPAACRPSIDVDALRVHGGVTFDSAEKGVACIGFDCAHSGDSRDMNHENFKSEDYVRAECKSLAKQIWAQLKTHKGYI